MRVELGVGQARRCRFWLGMLYYLPGIRWSFIDRAIDVVGPITTGVFLFGWYAASEWAPTLAAASCALAAFGYLAERRARKLLPRDLEMLRLVKEYREAHGLE